MLSNQPPVHPSEAQGPNGVQPLGATLDEVIAEINAEIGTLNFEHASGLQPHLPSAVAPDQTAIIRKQFVRFVLNETLVGIPLDAALEIGRLHDWTPLPNLPSWILGIGNIRGEIVSMVNLKRFFDLPGPEAKRGSPYIIMHRDEMKVGVVVDEIRGMFSVDPEAEKIQDNPYRSMEISSYISGVYVTDEDILHIMNVDKLLKSSRMNAFHKE